MTRFAQVRRPPPAPAPPTPATRPRREADAPGFSPLTQASGDPLTEIAEILISMLRTPGSSSAGAPSGTGLHSAATNSPAPEPSSGAGEPSPEIDAAPAMAAAPPPTPAASAAKDSASPAVAPAVEIPPVPKAADINLAPGPPPPTPALAERAPPAPAPTPAAPAADPGGSPKAIVRRWQGGVAGAGGGLPKPSVAVPADARSAADTSASAAEKRNAKARDGLTDAAKANLPPEAPKVENPPPPPPDNPIPAQTDAILGLSGRKLEAQSLPALVRSPEITVEGEGDTPGTPLVIGNELPRLTEKPVAADLFQVLTTPGAAEIAKLDPGATAKDGKPTAEAQRMTDALKQLTTTETEAERHGKGEPVVLTDKGPIPVKPLPPGLSVPVGQVVARLLAQSDATTTGVLEALREQTFAGGVLKKEFPAIGAGMTAELKSAIDSELHDIAAAAGISAAQLTGLVTARQSELDASAAKAAADAKATGDKAREQVAAAGQKTMDAVAGAADAADEEMLRRQEAAGGAADPAVINARRDRSIGWVKEHVTTQTTNYQKAGEARSRELTSGQRQQTDAYKALVQREQYRILVAQPTRPPRDLTDKPRETRLADAVTAVRVWGDFRIMTISEIIRLLLAAAAKTTAANRKAIETAGTTAIEAANVWAEDKVLAGQSWWTRFVARIRRWINEAKSLNTEWKVRRTEENRDAIAQDLLIIDNIRQQLAAGVTKDELLKNDQLTAAQKAVVKQFFDAGGDTDPLNFAVVRLRATIASSHLPEGRRAFETELAATPVGYGDHATVKKLEMVANADGGGFDANRIATDCHAAMDQLGTDEAKIFGALRGLTAFRGSIVRKAYRARFDSDLDDDLEDELSGDEYERAKAELAGQTSRADAVALHDAIAGAGTDEKAIMETLRNKTPAEIEAIRAEYLSAYGETLDAALAGDLDEGNEIDQAKALLSSDNDKADAIALDDAMRGGFTGLGTSEADIEKVYTRLRAEVKARAQSEHWTSAQMEAEVRRRLGKISANFETRYKDVAQYKEGKGDTVLERAFHTELSGPERDLANALQKNDLVAADAARIEIERQGVYASDEKLVAVMRSQYDRALEARRLDEGPARDMVIARKLAAWREERSGDGKPLDENEISRRRLLLEREMNAEIEAGAKVDAKASTQALTTVYEKKYRPSLAYELAFNMSGSDRQAAQALLKNGGWLSPLEEVDFATKGDGTDEDQLKKTLSVMTKTEIDKMAAKWEEKHPGKSFRAMLQGELSGRDEVDILDMFDHGVPETAKDQIKQENRRIDSELGELTGVLGGAVAGKEADWMRYQQTELAKLVPQLDRTDWPETEEGQAEREALAGKVEKQVTQAREAVEDHRRRIDSVTDSVTMVVGVVIAIVAGVFSGGTLTALIIGSLIGTAASMATKWLIKGGAYGVEEFGVDLAIGAVDLLTLKLGDKLVRPIKALMGKIPFGRIGTAVGRSGVAQKAMRLPGVGKLVTQAGKAVPRIARGVGNFASDSLDSAAGALSTTAAGLAFNDATWKGDPLANLIDGGGMSIMQAVIMGHMLKPVIGGLRGHVDTMRTEARMQTDVGRMAEAHDLLAAGYQRFQQENPGASTAEFLLHPEGRRVSAEITERGLLPTIESVNKRIAADAELRVAAVDSNAAATLTEAQAKAQAHAEALTSALPAKQREGTIVVADPTIEGRGVHVTPVKVDGRIIGVEVRVGPDATPLDVALHAGTVHAMQKYTGTAGRLRAAIENAGAVISGSGLKVGSRGWEARLELAKLPAIMATKLEGMGAHPLTPDAEARLLADVAGIDAQIAEHRAVLEDPALRNAQGRGFVAADDPDTILRKVAATEAALKDGGTRVNNQGGITERGVIDLETKLDAARQLLEQSRGKYRSDAERGALLGKARQLLAAAEATYHLQPGTLAKHLTSDPVPEVEAMLARPIEPKAKAAPGPAKQPAPPSAEGEAMRKRLAVPDQKGPHQLVKDIAAGGTAGEAAQARLDAMSAAPRDAVVVNITQAQIDAAYQSQLKGEPHGSKRYAVTIGGLDMIVYRSAVTDANPNPVVKFEAVMPPRSGKPVVYQFGNGELRVWRSTPSKAFPAGVLQQERVIDPYREPTKAKTGKSKREGQGRERQGLEDQQYSHREAEFYGSRTERAHVHGPGLGHESGFGIGPNPRDVNQILQNKGIEQYMRSLREVLGKQAPGAALIDQSHVEFVPGSTRQARIVYRIDIVIAGQRHPFAEFDIDIETGIVRTKTAEPGKPPPPEPMKRKTTGIKTGGIEPRIGSHEFQPLFDAIFNSVDRPDVIAFGLPRESVKGRIAETARIMSPAEVATAFAGSPDVSLHPPGPAASFDAATWGQRLRTVLDGNPANNLVIVDIDNAAALTREQKKALSKELKTLSPEDRRRIIVIRRSRE